MSDFNVTVVEENVLVVDVGNLVAGGGGGGGSNLASDSLLDTATFNGVFDATTTNVQLALNEVDDTLGGVVTDLASKEDAGVAAGLVTAHTSAPDPHPQYALTTHNHNGVYEPANANLQSHVASTSNPHNTTAAQVGAYTTGQVDTLLTGKASTTHNHDGVYETPAGAIVAANTAVSAHALAGDPHPQYQTQSEGDARYALTGHNHTGVYEPANANIQSHIGSTSNPHSVTASQVGAYTTGQVDTALAGKENTGVAAGLIAAHESAGNPHAQYMTEAESDAKYALTGHNHSGVYEPAGTAASALAAHIAASDPHSQYLTQTEGDSRYQQLGSDTAATWGSISGTITNQFDLVGYVGGEVGTVGSRLTNHVAGLSEPHNNATTSNPGFMSAADKTKLDGLSEYTLPTASATVLGGVKIGAGITIDGNGAIGTVASAPAWGTITGTLSNQTDLQTALNGKADTSHNHSGVYEPANANIQTHISSTSNPHSTTAAQVGAYTTGQVDTLLAGKENTGVAAGLITTHESALDPHTQYLQQTDTDGLYSPLSHNHSGVYAPVSHTHAAEDITSGTLNSARLPADVLLSSAGIHGGTY